MAEEVQISGKTYVSSKRAAEIVGYAQDYVGQLAREGQIDAQRVGGLWYVNSESILQHKREADEYVPQPPQRHAPQELKSIITLEGKEYISAARASEITGYHKDYVGQLARTKHVPSQQVGNRWYVDRKALEAHKAEKDALLAAVQREAVGLTKPQEKTQDIQETEDSVQTYFKYTQYQGKVFLPDISEREVLDRPSSSTTSTVVASTEQRIPIYIKTTPIQNSLSVVKYKSLDTQKDGVVRSSGITNKYGSFTVLLVGAVPLFAVGIYFLTNYNFTEDILSEQNDITNSRAQSMFTDVGSVIVGAASLVERFLVPEIEYRSR